MGKEREEWKEVFLCAFYSPGWLISLSGVIVRTHSWDVFSHCRRQTAARSDYLWGWGGCSLLGVQLCASVHLHSAQCVCFSTEDRTVLLKHNTRQKLLFFLFKHYTPCGQTQEQKECTETSRLVYRHITRPFSLNVVTKCFPEQVRFKRTEGWKTKKKPVMHCIFSLL